MREMRAMRARRCSAPPAARPHRTLSAAMLTHAHATPTSMFMLRHVEILDVPEWFPRAPSVAPARPPPAPPAVRRPRAECAFKL
ncbi:hypothetical protein EVAR_35385_1 [Eumeta japonica]|uniref:Uncharacterized protein n=1 Tax=Eumeta variegata TaxID=151549 RepID=A0A4C1XF13_EUMVA|nr:hypothetical protein EVAR_35385_1 [Eumeta japonica]